MLDELTSHEYTEVRAFAANEFLPEQRADLRSAVQCLVTARAAGVKGARLSDFLIRKAESDPAEEIEQDQAEMNRQMEKIAGLFAATEAAKPKQLPAPEPEKKSTGTLDGLEKV